MAGKYNESYFRGIDYILAVAGKHNVKVSLRKTASASLPGFSDTCSYKA